MDSKYFYIYDDLKGKIRARYKTQDNFATALGISNATLSAKLNCKTEFTHDEIARCVDLLGLSKDDIPQYFFQKLFSFSKQLKREIRKESEENGRM